MKSIKNIIKGREKAVSYIAVGLILLFMFLIAFFSSYGDFSQPGDSGTFDEAIHILAGYTYLRDLDYRLNPEHPPLAKVLAAIPLMADSSVKWPEAALAWQEQDYLSHYTLYHAGNDPAHVLVMARVMIMLLMLGLGLFIYKWAAEKFGRKVGLAVLFLFALYPDVIAHGRLVTTDIAAALGFVTATYYFDKALKARTWRAFTWAGIAFGLGQLLKFSCFVLFVVFIILIIVRAILDRKNTTFGKELWGNFKTYFFVSVISLLLVWIVYIPLVWGIPVNIEHALIENMLPQDARTLPLRHFLHLLEGNPITRALGHYLLGLMLVITQVVEGSFSFAIGHIAVKSITWYFPFAWLVKTPITIIVLFLWSLASIFSEKFYNQKEKFWLISLFLTPWLVYWAFTLKGSLNIGIRHLMPTIPFVLLLIGSNLKLIFERDVAWQKLLIGVLILFMAVSTLSNYPSFIGYFNETVPRDQRYKYLIDSSLDWGQDLLRLKKYCDDNKIKSIKVDYFGGGALSYTMPKATPWESSYGPTTGWLAVSATHYQLSKVHSPKEGKWSYGWLDNYKPTAQIGGSILVFNITPQDLIKNPPKVGYQIKGVNPVGCLE